MNNTQNRKIAQVTDKTLIVGVDIGGEKHFARAILARGFEVSKKPFPFMSTEDRQYHFPSPPSLGSYTLLYLMLPFLSGLSG